MQDGPDTVLVPDLDTPVAAVDELIRKVTQTVIMPRFGNLGLGDISEKRPGETVTTVDIAAETALAAGLRHLTPDSIIVGEEGVEAAPDLLRRLDDSSPVWIIDPIDGTKNFVEGLDRFAVIVAYRTAGKTLAGWIYDPIADSMCHGVKGQGAWFDNGRPIGPSQSVGHKVEHLTGCLGSRARRNVEARPARMRPTLVNRYRCVGREYFDIALGKLDFIQFFGRLRPWDHAAGVLILREAGRHVALTDDEACYAPGPTGVPEGNLLIAPDRVSWRALRELIVARQDRSHVPETGTRRTRP